MTSSNRYMRLIEEVFKKHHKEGNDEVLFERSDIADAAESLGIRIPKNIGDIIYSFRYRTHLPEVITDAAPEGFYWIIRPAGHSRYEFVLVSGKPIAPSEHLAETKVPDATPGIIGKYALNDEQALLAKVRYNRLIDVFTGITCYSLQSHLRTTVAGIGQVETDELYVGIDKHGAHYILTVQAKGRSDKIGIVQIEQDIAVCQSKFPLMICRPIAVQFLDDDLIAMFEFAQTEAGIRVLVEKHYRLVEPEAITAGDLEEYARRTTA